MFQKLLTLNSKKITFHSFIINSDDTLFIIQWLSENDERSNIIDCSKFRLFLIIVSPTAVGPTAIILWHKVISHQLRHLGILEIIIPVYLYASVLEYLCTCLLVYLRTCVPVYLWTCVIVNWCACVLANLCTGILVYQCISVLVYLCTCLILYLSTCLLVDLFTHVHLYLYTHVFVYLYNWVPIYLSTCVIQFKFMIIHDNS